MQYFTAAATVFNINPFSDETYSSEISLSNTIASSWRLSSTPFFIAVKSFYVCACGTRSCRETIFGAAHTHSKHSRHTHTQTPFRAQNLHELYLDIMHEQNCKLCETKRQRHRIRTHRTEWRKKNCNEIVGFRADINYMYYV